MLSSCLALAASACSSAPLLNFSVVQSEDISYATRKRFTHRVMLEVESLPDEAEVRRVAQEVASRFSLNDENTVFIYLPDMRTTGPAYAIAEFERTRLTEFSINETTLRGTRWAP